MENVYYGRIEALRALMRENSWDIVILTGSDPHASEYPATRWKQVEWLSGFTGEAGDLVVTRDHAGLWTDTRYFIQANKQLSGTGVELHKMRVPEQVPIPQWIASLQIDEPVIAIDGLCQTVEAVRELQEAVPSAIIVPVPDLLGALWPERPALPVSPIITLGEDLTGESRDSKLRRLRKWLVPRLPERVTVSQWADEKRRLSRETSAEAGPWRTSRTPYLAAIMDAFTEPDSETSASFDELAIDGVSVLDYAEVDFVLATLREEGVDRICLNPAEVNVALRDAIDSGDVFPEVVETALPIPLWKAVKNDTEIAGMREAHIEDGLVMEQFLFWLSSHAGQVNEWEAAQYLGSLRSAVPGYKGDSFETISAYGPSGALPHYVTPREGSLLLEAHGLYLVDSGGQYLFGTTDITRTVPLGPCTALEREDYTLVLKGHIGLAMAVFPRGTAGCQIDALAREPLWRTRRSFGHGTGHGVGFFLNVHEGPQDIRQNFNPQPLEPGMISSDEPGLYREGMHGVRHENLLLCRPVGDSEFGSFLGFETLTLCHFDTSCVEKSLLSADELQWLNAYNERVYRELSPRLPGDVAAWLREKTLPI